MCNCTVCTAYGFVTFVCLSVSLYSLRYGYQNISLFSNIFSDLVSPKQMLHVSYLVFTLSKDYSILGCDWSED